jgi:hypothetical protein
MELTDAKNEQKILRKTQGRTREQVGMDPQSNAVVVGQRGR